MISYGVAEISSEDIRMLMDVDDFGDTQRHQSYIFMVLQASNNPIMISRDRTYGFKEHQSKAFSQ